MHFWAFWFIPLVSLISSHTITTVLITVALGYVLLYSRV